MFHGLTFFGIPFEYFLRASEIIILLTLSLVIIGAILRAGD